MPFPGTCAVEGLAPRLSFLMSHGTIYIVDSGLHAKGLLIQFHSRLCTLTHTRHRDWFGCPGVTATTELLNIR